MRIIAAIGARSGSKGIPDKNIIDLGGKPVLAWSIEAAKAVPEIVGVYLSTDSMDYIRAMKQYYPDRSLLRPPELAQDDTPDYPWIKHLIDEIDEKPDLIVLLRPTTPLRDPALLSRAIQSFLGPDLEEEPTSMRSVHKMSESAFKMLKLDTRGWLNSVEGYDVDSASYPRQDYTATYRPNGYIDIIRVERVLTYGDLYGHKVMPFLTPRVTELDTPEDLEYLRWQVGDTISSKSRCLQCGTPLKMSYEEQVADTRMRIRG